MFRPGLIVLMAASTAACASAVTDSLDAAPAWFEARRDEVVGEGYPSLAIVESLENAPGNEAEPWPKIEASLRKAQNELKRNDPGPVEVTAEDMRAWVAEQKALVAKGEEPY